MPDFQEIDEIFTRSPAPPQVGAADGVASPAGSPPAVQPWPISHDHAIPAAAPKPKARPKGLLGVLVAIGVAIAKWWAVILSVLLKFKAVIFALKLLTFGKLLLTGGTMFLSMFLWSYRFGWPMAVGFVLSICIHECGHALAAHKLGQKIGIMIFIPFMGGLVSSRGGKNVTEDAFVGIMGPIAGTLTALVCVGMYSITHATFWIALAMLGFFMNLINLTPARPLDGGFIAALFSPKLLLPGIVLAVFVFHANLLVWILAAVSLPGTIHAWKHGRTDPYYQASTRDRVTYGLLYVGLIAVLATATLSTSAFMYSHHLIVSPRSHRTARPVM